MKASHALLPLIAAAGLLAGCASSSKHMMPTAAAAGPAPGKALIVFMRPSTMAFAIDAPVFRLTEDGEEFIGIATASSRFDYQVPPGNHEFMVSGEAADFLDATVAAGKTYYVIVQPRMGMWKARFSLRPVRRGPPGDFHMGMEEFRGWVAGAQPVTAGPSAQQWYQANRPDIAKKRGEYLVKWNNKTAADKADATLYIGDGE